MNRKGILILSVIALLFIIGGTVRNMPRPPFFSYTGKVMGAYLVEESVLEGKTELKSEENPGVLFEGVLLPYDSDTRTLYVPQSMSSEEFSGNLSVQSKAPDHRDFYVCAPADGKWQDKLGAIRQNYGYRLWLVSENYYCQLRLVITGTPIMSIQTERREEVELPSYEEDPDTYVYGDKEVFYGELTVFDPELSGEDYAITETRIRYGERGSGSRIFAKKAYNIDTLDGRGGSRNLSLLGMREDDSWKLNALYSDPNRIRDITASQIWQEFDAADENVEEPGPEMRYAELFMDGRYQGLYCLMEPVDRKKLQLDGKDVLYKVISWEIPDDSEIQESADLGWRVRYPIRLRYPKEITDYGEAWRPIREYLNYFYRPETPDYESALKAVDIDNLMDYSLFLMAVSASDNSYHNTYFAAYYENQGYTMLSIPWDLDQTFGDGLWTEARDHIAFSPDVSRVYIPQSLQRLHEMAPEEIGAMTRRRWEEYRKSFLDTEAICGLLLKNRDYLVETGAAARESARWPETGVSTDIEQVLQFQRDRMRWLDEYFQSW